MKKLSFVYKLTWNPKNGVYSEISSSAICVGTPSKVENGNTKGKQTMLYFKRVDILRRKLYRNKRSVMLAAYCGFYITIL